MELILIIAVLGGGAWLFRRLNALERAVAELGQRLAAAEGARPMPVSEAPGVAGPELEPDFDQEFGQATRDGVVPELPSVDALPAGRVLPMSPWTLPIDVAAPPPPMPPPATPDGATPGGLEALIGGRLPIWIGGAALVLSAFFLVRYSIESGLLGPGVRTVLALVFGAVLLAGGEAARRVRATRNDPRVAQALTGAGIAVLYGTLYMAGALYDLIGTTTAFLLMAAVTAAALGLSLRHGAPTAIMGLIGGFAAPLVAGIDGAALAPLLIYLALFTAALFGLAIYRGWTWLALAACAVAFGWANVVILLFGLRNVPLDGVGMFVLLLAIGASFALPRSGAAAPALRIAPVIAGLLQLIVLAPWLDFSPLAWGLYLLLSAAAIWLAVRDPRLAIGAVAALGLMLALLGVALSGESARTAALAAIAATALFGGAGHVLSRRATSWAVLAIGGTAGPLTLSNLGAGGLLADGWWAALCLVAGAACAVLSVRHRDRAGAAELGLVGGAFAAAMLAVSGLAQVVPLVWLAALFAAATVALALWGRTVGDRTLLALPMAAAAGMVVAMAGELGRFSYAIATSLIGEGLTYPKLPTIADSLPTVGLGGAVLLALLGSDARVFGRARRVVWTLAGVLAGLMLFLLAKQVLAIASGPRFVLLGFGERAAITQLMLAAGAALWLRVPGYRAAGRALVVLALARFVWFDLLIMNPGFVRQYVGGVPIANLATLQFGLLAVWIWLIGRATGSAVWRNVALVLTGVAVGVTVRQAVQGPYLTGAMGRSENYFYSVAYLGLALAWLWRGIATGSRSLRVAGLALLTLVTLKVFVLDGAALQGVLRILSFLGLGLALIAIGWAYGRFLGRGAKTGAAAPAGGS